MARQHYNSPDRYRAPWEDAGKHQTRTAALRRLWLHPPQRPGGQWTCCVAGEGSTCGPTREAAIAAGINW
jgi:hypothetical protein